MLFGERLTSSGSASSILGCEQASRVCLAYRKRTNCVQDCKGSLISGRYRPRLSRCKNRGTVVSASKNENEPVGSGKRPDRRTVLLNYVQEVEPQVMEQFVDQAPTQVVAAMRQTITNLLGTLPPQFFTVRVSTVGENLAQLMYSVMMTGYMFRNTQYRMELKNTLGMLANSPSQSPSTWSSQTTSSSLTAAPQPTPTPTAPLSPSPSSLLPSTISSQSPLPPSSSIPPASPIQASQPQPSTSRNSPETSIVATSSGDGADGTSSTSTDSSDSEEYAPGVQKTRVQGEVLRWHYTNGLEPMPAVDYIHMLEAEVASLKQQLMVLTSVPPPAPRPIGTGLDDSKNELLEYLKSLDAHSLQELTAGAGDEVTEAMNSFIHRMLGTEDKEELRKVASDCTATELGKLLFWLMVVGYSLRTLEVRYDMERSLDLSFGPGGKELPPPSGTW